MPRILTICPSIRDRKKISESFFKTSATDNTLVFSSKGTVTEAINNFIDDVHNYDFIHLTNDDVVYKTFGWDKILTDAIPAQGGISYGDDGVHGEALCTFPMISTNIILALGWAQLPDLEKYYGDTVWWHIGQECKCIHYCPTAKLEHLNDDKYIKHNVYREDQLVWGKWLTTQAYNDVLMVKGALHARIPRN